jgi:hypothetical protein
MLVSRAIPPLPLEIFPHPTCLALYGLVHVLDRDRRAVILEATVHLLERGCRKWLGLPEHDGVVPILDIELDPRAASRAGP